MFKVPSPFASCPICGCRVRADRLRGHTGRVHRERDTAAAARGGPAAEAGRSPGAERVKVAAGAASGKTVCGGCGKLVSAAVLELHMDVVHHEKPEAGRPAAREEAAAAEVGKAVCPDCGRLIAVSALALHRELAHSKWMARVRAVKKPRAPGGRARARVGGGAAPPRAHARGDAGPGRSVWLIYTGGFENNRRRHRLPAHAAQGVAAPPAGRSAGRAGGAGCA